jgi:hypothetical protein
MQKKKNKTKPETLREQLLVTEIGDSSTLSTGALTRVVFLFTD